MNLDCITTAGMGHETKSTKAQSWHDHCYIGLAKLARGTANLCRGVKVNKLSVKNFGTLGYTNTRHCVRRTSSLCT